MKYAALLSYDGTGFCGWQKQRGSGAAKYPSIQETLEQSLHRISGEKISIQGSGRTDSGVHATGQVAHFNLKEKEWEPSVLSKAMNGTLPPSIRVLGVKPVPADFHAQKSAEKKQYSFYIQSGPCALPYLSAYSWWIRRKLDLKGMQSALDALLGEHDFVAFQASGAHVKTTVRKMLEASLEVHSILHPFQQGEFSLIRIRLVGTGFLKQMVRGITGTLVQIGESRRPATDMKKLLKSPDRSQVGPTAPGRGLWLEKVWYPDLAWDPQTAVEG